MSTVTLDHLASRWDRSPDSLLDDVDRSLAAGVHVITLTEVADGRRPDALRQRDAIQSDAPWQSGEIALIVNAETGTEPVAAETIRIGPDLGPGNEVYGLVCVVRLATGETVLVAESHLPSSVERKWLGRRGRAYRAMVRRYRRAIREMRRLHRPDAEVIWADWNLNLRLAWVRRWAKKVWRGRPVGRQKMPTKGSHGRRLIDWPITRRLRKRRLTVLDQTRGSDHRGVRLRAEIKHPRKD